MSKNRSWCFTINNYDENDIEACKALNYKYLCIGFEQGESGTPHIQGYVTMTSPTSFNSMKNKLKGAHLEVAKGNATQNRAYCIKDGEYYEDGDIPRQGKRKDIERVREMVLEGRTMKDICMVATSYQSIRVAECFKKYLEPQRDFKTYVYWFYGPTGTGKSRCAMEMFPNAYWCMETNKWWEGYDAHETVIINDMRANFCTFGTLLNLLDRYPMRVECKGGSRQLLAKTIVITTCKSPEEMYPNMNEDIAQLLRRIDNVLYFGTELGTEVGGNTTAPPSNGEEPE